MADTLEQYLTEMQQRPEFDAIHEVVKAVDVWGSDHRLYRIEVYRDYSRQGDQPHYEVRYYIWHDCMLTPMEGEPRLTSTWISYNGPPTFGRGSVEDAVGGALSLLRNRIYHSSNQGSEELPTGEE